MHKKGKGFLPHPGYGSPLLAKNLHPSGLKEVIVFNPNGLNVIDNKTQCVRIASTVGKKKREEIVKKAAELKIRVLNTGKNEIGVIK